MATSNAQGSIRLAMLGKDEYVSFSAFLEAASDVRDILQALGPVVSPAEGGAVEWVVTKSIIGSFTVEIAPYNNPVVGAAIRETFLQGMDQITRRAERPDAFDDDILKKAKHLSSILNRDDTTRITVSSVDNDREVHVSQHIAANVDALIGVRYEEIGAVEGHIEAVNLHRGNVFSIYEFLSGRRVECSFGDEISEDVIAALKSRRRAIVYGVVRTNARGEPLSVRAERIEQLRTRDELPSISDLRGIDPDFTGGMDAAEYIRTMRDAT